MVKYTLLTAAFAAVFGFLCQSAYAKSQLTFEKTVLEAVAISIERYHSVNRSFPRNWHDIRADTDYADAFVQMRRTYGYDLRDRYVFLDQPPPYPGNSVVGMRSPDARVLMIRTVPLRGRSSAASAQLSRYVVVGYPNGNVTVLFETDALVQEILQRNAITIAVPPGAPEAESATTGLGDDEVVQVKPSFPHLPAIPRAPAVIDERSSSIDHASRAQRQSSSYSFIRWFILAFGAVAVIVLLLLVYRRTV